MYTKSAQQHSTQSLHTQPHISVSPAHFHMSGEGVEVPQPSLPQEDRDWEQMSSTMSTTSFHQLQPWQEKGANPGLTAHVRICWTPFPLLAPEPPACCGPHIPGILGCYAMNFHRSFVEQSTKNSADLSNLTEVEFF